MKILFVIFLVCVRGGEERAKRVLFQLSYRKYYKHFHSRGSMGGGMVKMV